MNKKKRNFIATIVYLFSILIAFVCGQVFEHTNQFALFISLYIPAALGIYIHIILSRSEGDKTTEVTELS